MAERFVGIDVALREHRIAVLDRDGEAVGPSFTIAASPDGVATLLRTLDARGATAAQTLVGLEASGHLWENLEAALVGAGYRVMVLNPLQTRRYRDVVRRKAKTDDIDAHVIAGLLRSGNHKAMIGLHYMHYNFGRIHKTLRVTPAMEAGVANHVWSLAEIAALSN